MAERIVLPPAVPDPLEPINRVVWRFNKALLYDVVRPTAKVYRTVVGRPVRTGIGNMGKNIIYPDRLVNNVLQGKWAGARDETYRFLCNTTIGVAGFFDVASKWHIPRSEADFGQTFGKWGWQPDFFLMLPLFGPSNDRDTVGLVADAAANPLFYISPYTGQIEDPLTYVGPYNYFYYGVLYNNLSDSVIEFDRFAAAEMDPYSELSYAWTFTRASNPPDLVLHGQQDNPSLETLGSVLFTNKNPEFPDQGKTRYATIPTTHRKLPFTFWLRPKEAPVIYIVPGLGSHRFTQNTLSLAEALYNRGFSVVAISSPFDSEFMENAATVNLPAYLPADGRDLHVALTEVDRRINALFPGRLGQKALVGYSMGALDTLYVAATQATNQSLVKFDRYVAINSPVSLLHGIEALDQYYEAPLKWPAAERTTNLENTFFKVAYLKDKLTAESALPFNDIESKFLIGFTFRLVLRDVIYDTQSRHNQGVLHRPINRYRRNPVYQEILQYSYMDYYNKFVVPYYQKRGMDSAAETLQKGGDLRNYEAGLRANPDIRVFSNQDDFLLDDSDLKWMHETFGANQLTIFDKGGHLGNLAYPAVQDKVVEALSGLK